MSPRSEWIRQLGGSMTDQSTGTTAPEGAGCIMLRDEPFSVLWCPGAPVPELVIEGHGKQRVVEAVVPTYEYRCLACRKRVSLNMSYEDYDKVAPRCVHCGSEDLKRLLSRVRFSRSDEARMESLADPDAWSGFDEDDPRAMARMMRKMGNELGEDLPPEFDEVVGRLESGESPEEIEKNLPDLGLGGDDFGE